MTNKTTPDNDWLDLLLQDHREWMRGIRTDRLIGTSNEQTKAAINAKITELLVAARQKLIAGLDSIRPYESEDGRNFLPLGEVTALLASQPITPAEKK